MKRLVRNESLAELGHIRNMLEQAGIRCMIKNEQLSGALGEIPFLDCLPELWVLDDRQAQQAMEVLGEVRDGAVDASPWQCSHCGESNEGQFVLCWQCGHRDPQS